MASRIPRRISANLSFSLPHERSQPIEGQKVRRPSALLGYYKDPSVQTIAMQVEQWERKQRRNDGGDAGTYIFPIDPRSNPYIGYWDGVLSLALVFTACFTPVEVGFMRVPEDRWTDPLFIVNRLVDCIFIMDMGLQFVLMYPASEGKDGRMGAGQWVSDPGLIARHYLCSGWFYLDFFSIGVSAFDIFTPDDSGAARLRGFRAVRVLRLLKLVRLARGSRIFRRWETRLSINYALLSIANICVMLVFVCHVFACVWGLQASFDPLGTWLGASGLCRPHNASSPCPDNWQCVGEEPWACVGADLQYVSAVYWSIATVTSIGYGDISATPLHGGEQVCCVCMMLIGSLLFAYLVGSFCGLAANLSPDTVRFRQDLTDLNKFLTANSIPAVLRYQLREYMHQTLHLRHAATGTRLLGDLAPRLRNEVALKIHERWLAKIDLINEECEEGLVLELAYALTLSIFPPGDSCPMGSIYIVSRGAALYQGRAYVSGASWGEAEALLTNPRLQFPIPASTLSYLFTYSIHGSVLRRTMSQAKYPEAAFRMRRRQIIWIMRRGIVRAAEEKLELRAQKFRNRTMPAGRRSLFMPTHLGASKMANLVAMASAAAKEHRKQGGASRVGHDPLARNNSGELAPSRLGSSANPDGSSHDGSFNSGRQSSREKRPARERRSSTRKNSLGFGDGELKLGGFGASTGLSLGGGLMKMDPGTSEEGRMLNDVEQLHSEVREISRAHKEDMRAIRHALGMVLREQTRRFNPKDTRSSIAFGFGTSVFALDEAVALENAAYSGETALPTDIDNIMEA